jgi:hypothetical protein
MMCVFDVGRAFCRVEGAEKGLLDNEVVLAMVIEEIGLQKV